ncbi:MAG: hypothetical protein ACFB20_02640 [Opitutales bacterium]
MKWVKRLFWLAVLCMGLLAVCVALLFVPAVQRQLALALIGNAAEEVELESVSAGFSGVQLNGLSVLATNGARLELSRLNVSGSMFSLVSQSVELDAIEVEGLRLDVSEVETEAKDGDETVTAEEAPAMPAQDIRELLDEFQGIFTPEGGLPVTLSLETLAVEGMLIGPESTQATFRLSGENIVPDTPSELRLRATLGQSASTDGARARSEVTLNGVLTLRQQGQADAPTVEAVLTAEADLPGFEKGLPVVETFVSARGTPTGEAYGVGLRLPLEQGGYAEVFRLDVTYVSEQQALNGDFAFTADEALRQQVARFFDVPEFSGQASGRIETRFGESLLVSVNGAGDGRITRMGAVSAEMAEALESVDLQANFNLKLEDTRLKFNALDATVISGDGDTLLLVSLPKALDVDLENIEEEARSLEGELLVVALNDIPAASLSAFLPPLPITDEETGEFARDADGAIETLELGFSQGTLSGRVVLEAAGDGTFSLRTSELIQARGFVVGLPQDDFNLTEPVDLELSFNSSFDGDVARADFGPLVLSAGGERFHDQRAQVSVSGILNGDLVIEGSGRKWTRLDPIMRQPLFAQDPFIGPWQALASRNPSLETEWSVSVVPDSTARVDRFMVALKSERGPPLFELVAPGGLAVSLADNTFDITDVSSAYGTLVTLSLRDFPLKAVNQPAIGLLTGGSIANLTLTLTKEGENLALATRQPADLRDLSFSFEGTDYLENFSLRGSLEARSDLADRVSVRLSEFSLREGRIPFAKADAAVDLNLSTANPVEMFDVAIVVEDMPLLFNQPFANEFDNLRRGEVRITGKGDFRRAGAFNFDVQARNLMSRDGFESVSSASATVTGTVVPGERFEATAPLRIRTTAGSTTEGTLTLEGRLGGTKETLVGVVDGQRFSLDDVNLLLRPFIRENDASPPERRLPGLEPRTPPEPVAPVADTAEPSAEWAPWVAALGFDPKKAEVDLSLKLSEAIFSGYQFNDLDGRLTQTWERLLVYFSAMNVEGGRALIQLAADFDAARPDPLAFTLKSDVAEFDPPAIVQSRSFDQRRGESVKKPLLDGLLSVDANLQGSGADFGDAFEQFQGSFLFESKAGTLNGLAGSNEQIQPILEIINNPLAGFALAQLGDQVKEVRGLLQVLTFLNELPYDDVRVEVNRDADFKTTIQDFRIESRAVKVALVRPGTIGNVEGKSLLQQPLDIPLQFWARGDIAGTLDNLRLMGPPEADGYFPLVRPFQIGGSLSSVESNLMQILLQPALGLLGDQLGGGRRQGGSPAGSMPFGGLLEGILRNR